LPEIRSGGPGVNYLQVLSFGLGASLFPFLLGAPAKSQVSNSDRPAIPAATRQELQTIRASAHTSVYSYEQVRFLSNVIGPRLSGSPQAAAAVRYVAEKMRDLGLEVTLQPVTVRHWVRGQGEAQLIRYPGQVAGITQKLVVIALGNSPATPETGITAEVVVVNNFTELDALPSEVVKGKIVLFNYPFDNFAALAGHAEEAYGRATTYRTTGPARAFEKGAAAALVRSVGPRGLRLPHAGVTRFEGDNGIPAGAITTEDADLLASLATQGQVAVHLLLTPRELPPEQSYNVIADLKGSRWPNQIVVVSGHLDSWDLGTGALDDACGVGIAMDAVRIIKEVNPKPARTIRFVAWMNEENGTAGGRAYAEDFKSELSNHVAAVELDYGDGRPLGIKVRATPDRWAKISGPLHAIGDDIGGVFPTETTPGSDLEPINQAGVPAIEPLQDARHYFDYHHTAADTFDKVRLDELRQTLEVITGLVYALSQEGASGPN
jgi:carboxypeptidase Q